MILSAHETQPSALTPDPIKDVAMDTFMKDVVEASRQKLVIVNFWATWSGPCKQLTPLLEKLVRSQKGAVLLAKVDMDKNQAIAQQLGVQSVPAVFAFHQGRPVDGFMGALPEAQLKAWLEQLLKTTGGASPMADIASALKQANELLLAKDIDTAQSIFGEILDEDPGHAEAYAGLLRCLLAIGDTDKVKQMLAVVPVAMAKDKAFIPIRTALELSDQSKNSGSLKLLQDKVTSDPKDLAARYELAMAMFAGGDREGAVEQLLDIVRRDRGWNDAAARKQLVKFFEAFGFMDPLSIAGRKKLSSILFS